MASEELKTLVLTWNDVPPSSNRNNGVGGRGHPAAVARTKRIWGNVWGTEFMVHKFPIGLSHIHVKPLIEFRTHHRRDPDNYYFTIAKPLADILVKRGHIPDDTEEFFTMDRVEILTRREDLPKHVQGRVTLAIEYR